MPGRQPTRVRVLQLVFLCFLLAPVRTAGQTSTVELASLPLAFERNGGQAPAQYRFIARQNSVQAFFGPDGVDVLLGQARNTASVAHISWGGAQAAVTLIGDEPLPGHSNYLHGADPAKWLKNIPQFAQIRYANLYPNIDLVFHGHGSTLEHDFLVQPGGEVSRITLRTDRRGHFDRAGNLLLDLGKSKLWLMRPEAYQLLGEGKKEVAANFVMTRNGELHFKVAKYDHAKPLIIDPVFVFSTYLDGSGSDNIAAVTTDAAGNIYVTGSTGSTDFPVTNAGSPLCPNCSGASQNTESFVSKLDPTGHTLLFSTYLGGSTTGGGFGTNSSSIALDKNQDIYVAGVTSSWDFPHAGSVPTLTPQNFNADYFFESCLKPDGSAFIYSGLVGGQAGLYTDGSQGKLAVDANGNTYLAGTTDDVNFQLTPGTFGSSPTSYPNDTMFVLKLNATGALVYSTLIPGNVTRPAGTAYADNFVPHGISVDGNGQVTVAGLAGMGLPTTPGALEATVPSPPNSIDPQAGFLLQLNAAASNLNFATYLPGTDTAGALVTDTGGNFYIAGTTSQSNLPVSANAYQKTIAPGQFCTCGNGYILKINTSGTSVLAGTYLSGPPSIGNEGAYFTAIALDSKSNVVVGGMAGGSSFPLQNPFTSVLRFSTFAAGLVLAEMTPDLSTVLFGSYLSSTSSAGGSRFSGLAEDPNDKLLVAGTTLANDFPTTAGGYQPTPLPPPNPLTGSIHSFISKLDLSIPAPSVCLSTTSLDLGTILLGTSSTVPLGIANCGNAVLKITGVASTLPSVVTAQNCASVAIGSTCNLQVTFTPADTSIVQGTLTLTDNAAISPQTVTISGKGGSPQVYFPTNLTLPDLLVGTHAEIFFPLLNVGDGAWVVANVSATGDFTVENQCTPAAPPQNICTFGITFAPKKLGLRSGTLTITDNVAGSPHVIALSGNSLSAYTTPSILGITAVAADAPSPLLQISGNNFFPASQVLVNGSPRTTTYSNQGLIFGTPSTGDLAQPAELTVTVMNPTPDGGASNSYPATVYDAIRNISFQHAVYDAKSGHIYASVATSSQNYANQMLVIDPASAKVLNAWTLGNGPNQLAISDDQQFLYVGLDADKKVAQVALPAGTVNFAVGLGNEPTFQTPMIADALRVLPGQPHSWAVTLCATGYTPCGNGVAVFDDTTERATVASGTQLQPDSLVFVGQDATTLYGTTLFQIPSSFYKFAITSAGISLPQTNINYAGASPGGGTLDTDGTSIYVSNGQVIDPATLNIKTAAFAVPLSFPSMRVDVQSSRVYFAGEFASGSFSNVRSSIQAFDLASQQPTGSLATEEYGSAGPEMYRWGTNGLEVGIGGAMLFFRTSLTSSTVPATQFFVSNLTPMIVPAGSPDQKITITGSGFANGDTVTASGMPLAITNVTATQITTTLPASLLSVAGDSQVAVTDTNSHVAYLEVVVSPGNTSVGLSTNVLNFAAQNIGTTSSAQTITLTNTGSSTLVISGLTASGDFSQTNNCSSFAAAGTCAVSVTFTPSIVGTRSGVLQITDNDVSKSQTVTLSGIGSDVQITASTTGAMSQTVQKGGPANYSLTITPQSGFSGALTFTCTNLPQYASCSFNPSSATLATAPLNVTVTIGTQQQQTAQLHLGPITSPVAGFLACLLLLPLGIGKYRGILRQRFMLSWLFVALIFLPLSGCGGGSSSNPAAATTTLFTPTGTYTVTFTVSSGLFSHSAPLTLIVAN